MLDYRRALAALLLTALSARPAAALAPPCGVAAYLAMAPFRVHVQRQLGPVRRCYERALASDPAVAGRVALRFVIDAGGAVTYAAVTDSTLGRPEVERCIEQVALRWRFPPPGRAPVTLTYPMVFVAQ